MPGARLSRGQREKQTDRLSRPLLRMLLSKRSWGHMKLSGYQHFVLTSPLKIQGRRICASQAAVSWVIFFCPPSVCRWLWAWWSCREPRARTQMPRSGQRRAERSWRRDILRAQGGQLCYFAVGGPHPLLYCRVWGSSFGPHREERHRALKSQPRQLASLAVMAWT